MNARTILLYAKRIWYAAISTKIGPCIIKSSADQFNQSKIGKYGKIRKEIFTGVTKWLLPDNLHTWGFPVYVLEVPLQGGMVATPKWDYRSRVGVYLGHSPLHVISVALVLNYCTGHVSPQYYVVFDDEYTTINHIRKVMVPGNWKG